jgi:hypothetical protein
MSTTRIRTKKVSPQCALCHRPAATVGEYQPSEEERQRWPFVVDCALCDSCNSLPDRGSRLSSVFGFSAELGRVQ